MNMYIIDSNCCQYFNYLEYNYFNKEITMYKSKIAIIGAGNVGATTAYSLMMRNIVSKIILVDINETKCKGEVYDLSDALAFSETSEITIGNLKEAGQADIVILSAGIAQKPGQSRIDLLNTNIKILKEIIKGMGPLNPEIIIIVVTNPVDILTFVIQKISGLPKNQIFGSGTFLDTQRLRDLISKKVKVSQQSIHVYILGEHGDSQFPVWSNATIAEIPLLNFKNLNLVELEKMANLAKLKAYDIISCKGSTSFGISSCVSAYCQNIIFDSKKIMPVSCYIEEFDVCMSMPVVLGNKGIEQILFPLFDRQETLKLQNSANILKNILKSLI